MYITAVRSKLDRTSPVLLTIDSAAGGVSPP